MARTRNRMMQVTQGDSVANAILAYQAAAEERGHDRVISRLFGGGATTTDRAGRSVRAALATGS